MKIYSILLGGLLALLAEPGYCNSPASGDSLMKKWQQADHFKGLIDLPTSSLHYALSGISDSTAQTFVQFGLAQIYDHPERAKLYAQKLQAFLHTHPLVRDEPADFHDGFLYSGTIPRSSASRLSLYNPAPDERPKHGIDGLLDLLPSFTFFKTLWGIFSLCCTLVVMLATTLYLVGRKNGTTFTLILNHNGQTTHL